MRETSAWHSPPLRPQHHHVLQLSLGAHKAHPLGADELSRLGEVLDPVEPIAHAEELIHARPAQVDMAPTGLYLHSDPPDHRFGQTFYLMCVHTSPPSA